MTSKIPWDDVVDKFDTYKDELYYGAADNIETVWPVVLDFIKNKIHISHGIKALDFGCGTGMFCRELQSLGFESFGIDVSPEMIRVGKEHLGQDSHLYVGDTSLAKSLTEKEGAFDLIVSIMVLQFIEDQKIQELGRALKKGGYCILVNHNPLHLKARGFTDTFTLGGTDTTIPLYQRSAEDYDALLAPLGFKRIFETYATESPEFLKKYNLVRPSDDPKYLVLAYTLN